MRTKQQISGVQSSQINKQCHFSIIQNNTAGCAVNVFVKNVFAMLFRCWHKYGGDCKCLPEWTFGHFMSAGVEWLVVVVGSCGDILLAVILHWTHITYRRTPAVVYFGVRHWALPYRTTLSRNITLLCTVAQSIAMECKQSRGPSYMEGITYYLFWPQEVASHNFVPKRSIFPF